MRKGLAIALGILGGIPARGAAQEALRQDGVAIVGGTVHTGAGAPIPNGTVVIRDGRIEAVGPGLAPPAGARVVRAEGCWVTPGFTDSGTSLGLVEIELVEASRDSHEKGDPIQPQLRALDAFHAASVVIPVTRVNGITSALVVPDPKNVLSGQSMLVHLDGATPADYLVKTPVAVHANLGESSRGEGDGAPRTRMGEVALLRKALVAAKDYAEKRARYERRFEEYRRKVAAGEKPEGDEPEPPARDLKNDALVPVLRGEIPLIVRARRASDLLLGLEIGREFGIRVILDGATEAWKVAGKIAEAKAPVIVGPITEQPEDLETLGAIYENAARLHAAGVVFAIKSADAHNARNLPYEAGTAVAYGLPWDVAFAAVTCRPAEILGAEGHGTLEPGKCADVVVWTGDPFQPRSVPRAVFIRGREIPLTNKQTELRDKFGK